MHLKGKRCGKLVCLRAMNEADALPYVQWLQDQEVAATIGAKRVPSVEERVEQLKDLDKSPNDLALGIELKDKSKLIGTIGLRDIDWSKHIAEASLFIGDKREWGKGYGTEAMKLLLEIGFKELDLKVIQLHTDPHNLRARHVFEKVGFREKAADKEFIVMVKEFP